jgi:outer membrane receptor protein involved in Fe transport
MNYYRVFILLSLFAFSLANAQPFYIKGVIKDATSNETLIGASVSLKTGVGTVTDLDGNFSLKVEPGVYTIKVFYVGYEGYSQKVVVKDKDVLINISLESVQLDEVEITANIGTVRETPVAISNISQQKIQEELGGRDITMLLNSTPGVYATEQGGGSGDSRITLRGFDQANIAVMVDGVPVNDMENGAVYWSNWDGLSEITKTMQVQRGLGATKLAVASVGGTMNIITNSIDQKQTTTIKRDFGNNNYERTSIGYNSGLVKNKFGVVFAGSYRKGDGWVQGTFIEAWSYFGKLQYKPNSRHLLSLSVNGAPQRHGMRTAKMTIGLFSRKLASDVGIENPDKNLLLAGPVGLNLGEQPLNYNADLATLNGQDLFTNVNFYHKPLFNFNHFWTATDKLTISSVAYASFGNGGGTGMLTTLPYDTVKGYRDYSIQYSQNENFVATGATLKYYGSEKKSSNIIRASMNNHQWYGLLSTAIYKIDTAFTMTFGVDARYYRGLHYRTVYDLFGGDYYRDNTSDKNQPRGIYNPFNPTYIDPNYKNEMKREGDKIQYNYDGLVSWGGLFSQLEYKKNKWTAFATLTGSYTGYQRKDYFDKKDVDLGPEKKGLNKFFDFFKDNRNDNVLPAIIGFNDVLLHNGTDYLVIDATKNTTYQNGDTTFVVYYNPNSTIVNNTKYIVGAKRYTIDSKEAKYSRTKKKWFPGFTIKGGVNYKINTNYNVYANVGVLSVAPKFNNVFNGNTVGNKEFKDANNQLIISQEVGGGVKFKKFAGNVNVYYTIWNNKPVPTYPFNDELTVNINGVNATHAGIEFDWNYNFFKNIEWESALAIANWKYSSNRIVYVINDLGNIVDSVEFSAKGVHVGNAAQFQWSNSIKYKFYKGFYIKPRYTYFGKNYSSFDATSLSGVNANRDSWKMPNYGFLDFNAGFESKFEGLKLNFTLSVNNVLNTIYISDAQNNAVGLKQFDANSAIVFMGQGRRFIIGLRVTF